MIEIVLKNNTAYPYKTMRNMICSALTGNRGFIEDDIVVSDVREKYNGITICLGDEQCGPGGNLILAGDIVGLRASDQIKESAKTNNVAT